MNWKKTLLFISTAIGTTTLAFHVINKFIFNASDEHSEEDESNYYNWKFGNIYYKKEGTGSPVLLIHDLNHYSSSMEWDKVIGTLSKEHTVHTIDLLGCGKSDKPAITYTCYLYVQLLTDFIRDIIGEKTDIVATGASASFVTAACQNIADQIDHIILVCPESTHALAKAPNHKSKLLAKIINIPIYGTFIYNVGARNTALSDSAECKYLYASILGHYTTVNVAHCLEGLTTSIAVITGKNAPETSQKATEYCHILPSIEHLEVPGSGLLPQRENANAFLEQLDILLFQRLSLTFINKRSYYYTFHPSATYTHVQREDVSRETSSLLPIFPLLPTPILISTPPLRSHYLIIAACENQVE